MTTDWTFLDVELFGEALLDLGEAGLLFGGEGAGVALLLSEALGLLGTGAFCGEVLPEGLEAG